MLYFFGVLVLLIYNITGCSKHDTPADPPPIPTFYMVDDSATGIFNYTGIAYDSVQVIDSIFPPITSNSNYPSGYHTIFKTYTHQVSGRIRIKKLTSDSTIIFLTRPINDNYDDASAKSGMIFQTDSSYFPYSILNMDTVIWANYYKNNMNIQHSGVEYPDVLNGFITIPNGDGKFVKGKWEINYPSSGHYSDRIVANPMPADYLLSAYHTYHLICTK